MRHIILTSLGLVLVSSPSGAQDSCLEPFRPNSTYLDADGYDATEIREEYQMYFKDVEVYLNCLNSASRRIREEATKAAREYSQLLDKYPLKPGEGAEYFNAAPTVEMTETGTLFLDYQGGDKRD